MRSEINTAAQFIRKLVTRNHSMPEEKLDLFESCLKEILKEHYENHWYPDCPWRGQAYRSLRWNNSAREEPLVVAAARQAGLEYHTLDIPLELTIWVDPDGVAYRFGESKGSHCAITPFKDGDVLDNLNSIDINIEALSLDDEDVLFEEPSRDILKNNSPKKTEDNESVDDNQLKCANIMIKPSSKAIIQNEKVYANNFACYQSNYGVEHAVQQNQVLSHPKVWKNFGVTDFPCTMSQNNVPLHLNDAHDIIQRTHLIRLQKFLSNAKKFNNCEAILDYNQNLFVPNLNKRTH